MPRSHLRVVLLPPTAAAFTPMGRDRKLDTRSTRVTIPNLEELRKVYAPMMLVTRRIFVARASVTSVSQAFNLRKHVGLRARSQPRLTTAVGPRGINQSLACTTSTSYRSFVPVT